MPINQPIPWVAPYEMPVKSPLAPATNMDMTAIIAIALIALVLIVWDYCIKMNLKRDNPQSFVCPVRYPDVFDCVMAILRTSYVKMHGWTITYVNADEGTIQASCRFWEDLSKNYRHIPRHIVLKLTLIPLENSSTKVFYHFTCLSEHGRGAANDIIDQVSADIRKLGETQPEPAASSSP